MGKLMGLRATISTRHYDLPSASGQTCSEHVAKMRLPTIKGI
jgi:hypothetical protein